jgi:RHS repeat-associated protein
VFGYRYDTDTGLYYLQSRYYNADWGRFINADGLVGTPGELLSCNMFAYCGNNPVNRDDQDGQFWGALLAGIGAVVMLPEEIAVVFTVTVILVAAAVVIGIISPVDDYRINHVTYADSSADIPNPILDGMEKRIPNSELNPRSKKLRI